MSDRQWGIDDFAEDEQNPVTEDDARAEAERRYPKRPFVVESHVQNAFIAGAVWQASKKEKTA